MCQVAVRIPDAVLYDTHMSEWQAEDFARKTIAVEYYRTKHISLGYCAEIAGMDKESFIKYLGSCGVSIFSFDGKDEFQEEMNNA